MSTISLQDLIKKSGAPQLNQASNPGQTGAGKFSLNELIDKGNILPEKNQKTFSFPAKDSFVKNAIIGVGKSGWETLKNLSSFGEKTLQAPMKLFGAKFPEKTAAETIQNKIENKYNIQPDTLLKPAGGTQEAFKMGTDVAQFFIPAGAEAKAVKTADELIDGVKLAETFGPQGATIIKNIVKMAASGGVTGASMAGVTAAEGGNQKDVKDSLLWGSFAGAASKAIGIFAPDLIKSLAKSSLKMSPAVASKAATKADAAATFIADNGLSLNPSTQFRQASKIENKLESVLQKNLTDKFSVSPEELIASINNIPNEFKNDPAFYKEVKNGAKAAVDVVNEINVPNGNITLNDLLSGKRSYGESAFGKSAAIKTTGVINKTDFAIEQAYQDTLESAIAKTKGNITIPPELQKYFGGKANVSFDEYNKVYSQVINTKKFSNIAQNKRDTQLMGRLFGLWAGRAVGSAIAPGLAPELIGAAAGELSASHLPGMLRAGSNSILKNPNAIATLTKILNGLKSKPSQ